jgi:hypothetical protein
LTSFSKRKKNWNKIIKLKCGHLIIQTIYWNKISFVNLSKSFDDNKVLNVQLDLLIYVQVCSVILEITQKVVILSDEDFDEVVRADLQLIK